MATFTESQITDLCRIFATNSDLMADHLDYHASLITESDKTALLLDVTAYEAIEDDNVYVTAGPAGFEGRISPDEKRSLIRKRIAGLIHWPLSAGNRLVRA